MAATKAGGPDGRRTRARRVLFLQGPPTVFWRELAADFEAQGHETRRVNLSTADWLTWRRPGAESYRGTFSGWRRWLGRYLDAEGITDVLYYADRLPYHVVAAEEAERRGIPCHAVEFGYLRPDWLTLERRGMGAYSHFPNDPATIRALAEAIVEKPELGTRYAHSFIREATDELLFNLVNALFCWPWPFFDMDKRYHPLTDYPSWIPRLMRGDRLKREAEAVVKTCVAGAWPYHLFALQIEADYQLRDNSPYDTLAQPIEEVIASFARHAGPDHRLVFKLHPLDNGLENWPRLVRRRAEAEGVGERVVAIDGGDLDALLRHANGALSVNSTVGLHAIRAGTPTLALGPAVYDMPGLTHQGPLASFWSSPEPVDANLAADLMKVLADTIQVKGSFYNKAGRALAAQEIVRRVAAGEVNEPGAFVPAPPRLPVRRRDADVNADGAFAAAGG